MKEEWKPIVGYEGLYEVSNMGGVKSLPRIVTRSDGRTRTIPERVKKASINAQGYVCVHLHKNGVGVVHTVHSLVMAAFVGPRPEGYDVCHHNDDRSDPRLENLRYDTRRENSMDAVKRNRHFNIKKTHCHRGHPLSGDNIYDYPNKRICKTCARGRARGIY